MKHGRRHDKLKEQAYKARQRAEGYGRPYAPMDVTPSSGKRYRAEDDDDEGGLREVRVGDVLHRRTAHALRRLGISPEDEGGET